jgi:hypothetical protein
VSLDVEKTRCHPTRGAVEVMVDASSLTLASLCRLRRVDRDALG